MFVTAIDLVAPRIRKVCVEQLDLPMAVADQIVTEAFARQVLDEERYDMGEAAFLRRHPVVYWWPWSEFWRADR